MGEMLHYNITRVHAVARPQAGLLERAKVVIPREGGVSSTLRLTGSIAAVSGILGHPSARVTTTEYDFAISRRESSEVCFEFTLLEIRGRREDRVHAAPAVPC